GLEHVRDAPARASASVFGRDHELAELGDVVVERQIARASTSVKYDGPRIVGGKLPRQKDQGSDADAAADQKLPPPRAVRAPRIAERTEQAEGLAGLGARHPDGS